MTGAPVRPLVAGNWKMNGLAAQLAEAQALREGLSRATVVPEVMICPPATLLAQMAWTLKGSGILLGGQDCHTESSGAFTGDLAAEMLADAGARAVIVGHSERRAGHGELDRIVRAKAAAAHRAGLISIVCVGETAGERAAGLTEDVVHRQLEKSLPDAATAANAVIAYEPVWAIGTGLTPTTGDIARVHVHIRALLQRRFASEGAAMRILYGGSVKPANARELMRVSNVNGALVGGASLKASDFLGIISAYGA